MGVNRTMLASYAQATAEALQIPIAAEYREAVLDSLETLFVQAERLMTLELAPEDEAAPMFRPSEYGDV